MAREAPASILALNAGSSSLKFALFQANQPIERGRIDLARGDRPATAEILTTGAPHARRQTIEASCSGDALAWAIEHLRSTGSFEEIAAVGHRVVHGGVRFGEHALVCDETLAAMEELIPLAPLHQPHNLAAIRHLRDHFPHLPQVACFDTAFHAVQDRRERLLPLPREFADRGIVRYGFHGLSYEAIADSLAKSDPERRGGKAIVLHLGNGASACAMAAGRSVATTMSFTTVDGLMMGTRPGSLDPGLILHLIENEKMPAQEIHDLLYRRSGLLGVSGQSADMRDLLASEDPAAIEAVELFCYRAAREIGSLAAALEGVDSIVFTGGIGEHAVEVRRRIAELSEWLGVRLNEAANRENRPFFHSPGSCVALRILPTDEEGVIARHTARLVGVGSPS